MNPPSSCAIRSMRSQTFFEIRSSPSLFGRQCITSAMTGSIVPHLKESGSNDALNADDASVYTMPSEKNIFHVYLVLQHPL